MAAPVPSTGAVATSPSWTVAIAPPANELAGGTVAGVLALVLGLVLGLAEAVELAVALAVAVPGADAVGLAEAVGW
jgi:hypothetical protein